MPAYDVGEIGVHPLRIQICNSSVRSTCNARQVQIEKADSELDLMFDIDACQYSVDLIRESRPGG